LNAATVGDEKKVRAMLQENTPELIYATNAQVGLFGMIHFD
jgi:hypothetical protein